MTLRTILHVDGETTLWITTTSEPYAYCCQFHQRYTTCYMEQPHDCNEQLVSQPPLTDVTGLSFRKVKRYTSMQTNRLTVTRCRRAGVGSTTFTLAQMTVAMLLWSSVMTWIYSCCWSTGHCTVIYKVISPSRWRSGTVLSYK